jgi:opacity protein-like surface antigen
MMNNILAAFVLLVGCLATAHARQAAPAGQSQAQVEATVPGSPSHANAFRRFEINWNVLSYQRQDSENFAGGTLGLVINANQKLGIAADYAVHESSIDGIDVRLTTYRFGPKFSDRVNDRVTVFAQVLAGGVHLRGDVDTVFGGSNFAFTITGNGISFFGGGGVDVGVKPWFAIRVIEGGYTGFYIGSIEGVEAGWSNGFRISGGVVFRFGRERS